MGLHEEISELEQRFAESPDSRLFLPLADALRRAGELERAVKLCRDGLERFPDFNSARVLLGECLADMGELDEAGNILRIGRSRTAATAGSCRPAGRYRPGRSGWRGNRYRWPAEKSRRTGKRCAARPAEPELDAPEPAGQPGAGEMFITHTLGDIYKMQGHERKAFEVYSKLAAEGKADAANRKQAPRNWLAAWEKKFPGKISRRPRISLRLEGGAAVMEMARSESGEGRFEERIDTIFHFLLGDSPEHAELEHSTGVAAGAKAEYQGAAASLWTCWKNGSTISGRGSDRCAISR